MAEYGKDLNRWIPRLLAAWRKRRNGGRPGRVGPPDALAPDELREVARGVRELSMGLTRDRGLAGAKYMDQPHLLGAYLLFYWPVSYGQTREALGELPRPRSVLDLGSGPGPVAFAALDAGAKDVTCADRSKPALDLARDLAIEAGEGIATREWNPERPLPDGKWNLITAGHLINELFLGAKDQIQKRAALLSSITERLEPKGTLLVLDPALRETSRALLQVRDVMVEQGFAVRAPCLFRGPCPALVRETDWCHAERRWNPPRLVAELAQQAGLHKDSLKMSYLALAPKGEAWAEPPAGRVFRIVSEPLGSKGRQRYMGCGPEGRIGLAMQDRFRGPVNERFFSLQRGDVIRIGSTEAKGDGAALGPESAVEVIAPAGAPVDSSR